MEIDHPLRPQPLDAIAETTAFAATPLAAAPSTPPITARNGVSSYPNNAMATLRTSSLLLGATLVLIAVGASAGSFGVLPLALAAGVLASVAFAAAFKAYKAGISTDVIAANALIFGALGAASTGMLGGAALMGAGKMTLSSVLIGGFIQSSFATWLETKTLNIKREGKELILHREKPKSDAAVESAEWRARMLKMTNWIGEGLQKASDGMLTSLTGVKIVELDTVPEDLITTKKGAAEMMKLRTAAMNIGALSLFAKGIIKSFPYGEFIVAGFQLAGAVVATHYAGEAYKMGRSGREISTNTVGFIALGGLMTGPFRSTVLDPGGTYHSISTSTITYYISNMLRRTEQKTGVSSKKAKQNHA